MNFDKSIGSISTIAHELGHSMNSLYINKKQKVYADVSIFYAEISSIVNETLLSYYLLDYYRNDLDMKKMILDELINNFIATTTRQIIFSATEYALNNFVNAGKPFTKEVAKQTYEAMMEKYQGIDADLKIKMKKEPYTYLLSTILRIPHFYVGNFYVYKYAVGQIVAVIVANKIFHGDKTMQQNYLKFLSSGNSLSPIDTIKLLGVDLFNSKTYSEAKSALDD
jgi:oligoendopeptidase F